MDRMIYVALTGARESLRAQTTTSQNLANVATPGFRAVTQSVASSGIDGPGFQTRVNPVAQPDGYDRSSGSIAHTGNNLDVAIQGDGWFAVQDASGNEAYTRAGDLRINTTGLLENGSGRLVLGNGGPISIPQFQQIFVGTDGQISIVPQGQSPTTLVTVDRLKLVNPPPGSMIRSPDGLFRIKGGGTAEADASVTVASSELESSNVNAAKSLVEMIQLARSYEMQVRSMKNAEDNDAAAQRLMRSGG
jgi:flagellar basal-body rod protein FlgF